MCKLYNTTTEKQLRGKENVYCMEYDDTKLLNTKITIKHAWYLKYF